MVVTYLDIFGWERHGIFHEPIPRSIPSFTSKSRPGNQDRQAERRSTPQVLIGMAWDPSPSRSIALSAQLS